MCTHFVLYLISVLVSVSMSHAPLEGIPPPTLCFFEDSAKTGALSTVVILQSSLHNTSANADQGKNILSLPSRLSVTSGWRPFLASLVLKQRFLEMSFKLSVLKLQWNMLYKTMRNWFEGLYSVFSDFETFDFRKYILLPFKFKVELIF